MSAVNRYAYACDRSPELRQMHDFAAFILHLHFLFCVATIEKRIDVRQNIKRDRMRINLRRNLIDSLPARRPFGLPVYVAGLPPAPLLILRDVFDLLS